MLDLAKSSKFQKAPKEDKEVNRSIEQVAIWLQREGKKKTFSSVYSAVSLTKKVYAV